jgi:hypothetical protein
MPSVKAEIGVLSLQRIYNTLPWDLSYKGRNKLLNNYNVLHYCCLHDAAMIAPCSQWSIASNRLGGPHSVRGFVAGVVRTMLGLTQSANKVNFAHSRTAKRNRRVTHLRGEQSRSAGYRRLARSIV